MMLVVFFVYFPDHNCLVIDPVYNIIWALRPRTSDNIVGGCKTSGGERFVLTVLTNRG